MLVVINYFDNTDAACHDSATAQQNGRESAANRALDGSTYLASKLVPSSV